MKNVKRRVDNFRGKTPKKRFEKRVGKETDK